MGFGDTAPPVLKKLTADVREIRPLPACRLGIIDDRFRLVRTSYRNRSKAGLVFLRALLAGILSDNPTGAEFDDGLSISLPTPSTPRGLGGGARLSMDSVIGQMVKE